MVLPPPAKKREILEILVPKSKASLSILSLPLYIKDQFPTCVLEFTPIISEMIPSSIIYFSLPHPELLTLYQKLS